MCPPPHLCEGISDTDLSVGGHTSQLVFEWGYVIREGLLGRSCSIWAKVTRQLQRLKGLLWVEEQPQWKAEGSVRDRVRGRSQAERWTQVPSGQAGGAAMPPCLPGSVLA